MPYANALSSEVQSSLGNGDEVLQEAANVSSAYYLSG